MDITNTEQASRLLRSALAGKPELTEQQFDDLLSFAEVVRMVDEVPVIIYTDQSLSKAASAGWGWKSALTAEKYELAGGSGRELSEQQWWEHCTAMSLKYGAGVMSVTGQGIITTRRASGIRSVGMVSSAAVEAVIPEYIVNAPEVD